MIVSYKKLQNFNLIFNRSDFSHISDLSGINRVLGIILQDAELQNGNKGESARILNDYQESLESFYRWLNTQRVAPINEGFELCSSIILRIKKIIDLDAFRKMQISKGYRKKFKKLFLYGLSQLVNYPEFRSALNSGRLGKLSLHN